MGDRVEEEQTYGIVETSATSRDKVINELPCRSMEAPHRVTYVPSRHVEIPIWAESKAGPVCATAERTDKHVNECSSRTIEAQHF